MQHADPPLPVQRWQWALSHLPLVAILRGITPAECQALGPALVEAGLTLLEVPLNSPQPLDSIAQLLQLGAVAGSQVLVGAGTVLNTGQVREVHAAGGRLIVAPNFNESVVRTAVDLGMVALPGVMTPTEAFAALDAGAQGLKLFPAEMVPPAGLRAWRAVLPASVPIFPVGGIGVGQMAAWRQAGASGFGIGSALYKPGAAVDHVQAQAHEFVRAWRQG